METYLSILIPKLRMELDLAYVRRAGLRMDLEILARTLPAVIERKGAY